MGRLATVLLPILTLVLGVAMGKWWSDRDHAANRGREEASRSTERRLTAPTSPDERRAENGAPAAPPSSGTAAVHGDGTAPARPLDLATSPAPALTPTPPPTDPKAAEAPQAGGASPDPAAPATAPDGGQEEAAAKMLAVLFTNPAFRDRIVDQMVAQVGERVTFSDTQREAAKKELAGALQPLVELFQKGPVDFKDLDPKFQVVKEDWKRRLTPLLTAEQGLAFQSWLDEKHSLQVKMGMDEKGNPKDPDEPDDR